MEFKDYYSTLGVAKTATEKEIKQAYRKLARKHHPDVNPGDKSAESRFKELNEAYEVLGDSDKRRKYDELGANWRMYEQAGAPGGPGTARTWRLERALRGRRPRRIPDHDRGRNAGDVRRRRIRSPTSSTRSSEARWIRRTPAGAAAPPRRGRAATAATSSRRSRCRWRRPRRARRASCRSRPTATRARFRFAFRQA